MKWSLDHIAIWRYKLQQMSGTDFAPTVSRIDFEQTRTFRHGASRLASLTEVKIMRFRPMTGMINCEATIFLITYVLEIVERLCRHVAIISKGRLVAIGSLNELRAGAPPAVEQGPRFTLEEIFLAILGADGHQESTQVLSWLA